MIQISNRFRAALTAVLSMVAIGCSSEGVGGPGDEVMNFYEQKLVGLWSRFHAYDGSSQYIRFDADRTACKWEEAGGSNLRTDKTSYPSWQIDENDLVERVNIVIEKAGISWHFDYLNDEIWPASYTNLAHGRDSSGKACET